jgi:hypothetical protein
MESGIKSRIESGIGHANPLEITTKKPGELPKKPSGNGPTRYGMRGKPTLSPTRRRRHRIRKQTDITHHRCTSHLGTVGAKLRKAAIRTGGSTNRRSRRPGKLRRGWRNCKFDRLQLIVQRRVEWQMEKPRGKFIRMVGQRIAAWRPLTPPRPLHLGVVRLQPRRRRLVRNADCSLILFLSRI